MNAQPVAAIRFESVSKEYVPGVKVVDDVSLEVSAGAFVVILGASGSGKTTLLKMVNRLIEATSGRILVRGEDARTLDPPQLRRQVGYVIQQVGLFPHMTVADNIGVVPALLGWTKRDIAARVDELLGLVHLPGPQYRGRYPRQLSGGQQQRVGLARALAGDPSILLMDEPFGAVDAIERAHLQDEVASLHGRFRKSVLFVTHDVEEALRLADRIVVMRDGKVEQYDTPLQILLRPANDFVGRLVEANDFLRRLSVIRAGDAMVARTDGACTSQPTIAVDCDLRAALSTLMEHGGKRLSVLDVGGNQVGSLSLEELCAAARAQKDA